jgi:prolyl-tRNA editing enzyme YbaK/EbsC (Cys-tRNA(Pro) deacylase)
MVDYFPAQIKVEQLMQDKKNLGVDDVRAFLKKSGFDNQIVELSDSARTAQLAAESIGTSVAQIVKSLIFKGNDSGTPILVLASGANRVDESKVAKIVGEAIKKADADFVRNRSGFSIGGVPPFAHLEPMRTVIDEDLLRFAEVWSAAGHPHAVVCLQPKELLSMSQGQSANIKY